MWFPNSGVRGVRAAKDRKVGRGAGGGGVFDRCHEFVGEEVCPFAPRNMSEFYGITSLTRGK